MFSSKAKSKKFFGGATKERKETPAAEKAEPVAKQAKEEKMGDETSKKASSGTPKDGPGTAGAVKSTGPPMGNPTAGSGVCSTCGAQMVDGQCPGCSKSKGQKAVDKYSSSMKKGKKWGVDSKAKTAGFLDKQK